MPAKFQLKKGSTGKFRFTLLSTNGQVVATSQAYERKATALAGIRSVQKIAATAEIEDTTTKQWADADAAAKVAKKSAKKAPAKAASAAKRVVTKTAKAAASAPKRASAASTSTPRKSVAASSTRPVRKQPPPLTTEPKNLTPKL